MKTADWMRYLLTNSYDVKDDPEVVNLKQLVNKLAYDTTRAGSILEFAKERFKEAESGFESSMDTLKKLLALAGVAVGWFFTKGAPETKVGSIGVLLLVLAALVLLLGNKGSTTKGPCSFTTLVEGSTEEENLGDPDNEWKYFMARQYAVATLETSIMTSLVHKKLSLAVWLLAGGLLTRWFGG